MKGQLSQDGDKKTSTVLVKGESHNFFNCANNINFTI